MKNCILLESDPYAPDSRYIDGEIEHSSWNEFPDPHGCFVEPQSMDTGIITKAEIPFQTHPETSLLRGLYHYCKIFKEVPFYNIKPNVSWLGNNVRRVFDITDVGAIVYKLHIFYVDWRIFLVKVSSPADSVLKWWIIPSIHLPWE